MIERNWHRDWDGEDSYGRWREHGGDRFESGHGLTFRRHDGLQHDEAPRMRPGASQDDHRVGDRHGSSGDHDGWRGADRSDSGHGLTFRPQKSFRQDEERQERRGDCRDDHRPRGDDDGPSPAPAPQHAGGDLGWDAAAWAEAGGFDAVLIGHLAGGLQSASGAAPILIVAIENLDIDIDTLIQNTLIQNTQIVLNAANGGSVEIGGDVNAISSQQALLGDPGLLPEILPLA